MGEFLHTFRKKVNVQSMMIAKTIKTIAITRKTRFTAKVVSPSLNFHFQRRIYVAPGEVDDAATRRT